MREFFNRTNTNERVTMTCHLLDFKMENGMTMTKHLDKFDEIIVVLQHLGEPIEEAQSR